MFAGFSNAPITAIILLLELTNNYSILLPIIFTASASSITVNLINHKNIYSIPEEKND